MSKRKAKPADEATPKQDGDAGDSSTGATAPQPVHETTEEPAKGDDSVMGEEEPTAEGDAASSQEPQPSPGETVGAQREQGEEAVKVTPGRPAPRRGFFAQLAHWLWTDVEGNA